VIWAPVTGLFSEDYMATLRSRFLSEGTVIIGLGLLFYLVGLGLARKRYT